jgi:hypothetical protein
MAKPTFTIYAVIHIPTGKAYVGKTKHLEDRRRAHLDNPTYKYRLGGEIRRLGAHMFNFHVLAHSDILEEASQLERFWIHLLEANDPQYGYNSPRFYALEPLPTNREIMQFIHGM